MKLREFLVDLGYTDLRVVNGKLCALRCFDLATGLVVWLDVNGCQAVYSYENEFEARAALAAWDGSGHPSGPWIRLTGLGRGRYVNVRNPAFAPPVFMRVAA